MGQRSDAGLAKWIWKIEFLVQVEYFTSKCENSSCGNILTPSNETMFTTFRPFFFHPWGVCFTIRKEDENDTHAKSFQENLTDLFQMTLREPTKLPTTVKPSSVWVFFVRKKAFFEICLVWTFNFVRLKVEHWARLLSYIGHFLALLCPFENGNFRHKGFFGLWKTFQNKFISLLTTLTRKRGG